MKSNKSGKRLFSQTTQLNCSCEVHICEHVQRAMGKGVEAAWQSGRKAGISLVIERLKEASRSGLVLRLKGGEPELPPSLDNLTKLGN